MVELHGNTTYARCIGCGQRYEIAWVRERFEPEGIAPACTACDEPVKSATISFGQSMPEEEMRRATELAQHCDLKIGVVPVINLEWIQKIHRDRSTRGYSTEAVTDVILRRMHEYVHFICPQFTRTDRKSVV